MRPSLLIITKGRELLRQYYDEAAAILDGGRRAGRLHLTAEASHPGEVSCHDVNKEVSLYMAATPPCWTCWLERRYPNHGTGYNENTLVCMAITQKGGKCVESERIVFDYFDVAFHEGDPNPPNPIIEPGTPYSSYISNYRMADPDWFDPMVPYEDCSHQIFPYPKFKSHYRARLEALFVSKNEY